MKLIFVTGGVISGLGKGITAASIGRLMKSAGYKVNVCKMDPYLQIDAGTMSPYEHGETFVTKDGFETDLDLGHYERFIDEELTKYSSITTGQIYKTVIDNERKGKYLGQTVQVIPHIINEIKDRIRKLSEGCDISILEIGGTVGDIEGPHFIETMRQLRHELGKSNVLFVHVAPIITVSTSGEQKTKAIQHSIIKLRELGIHSNILICRTQIPLELSIKNKLSMFCDIEEERIIEAIDQNIYQVPLSFQKQGLDQIIIERFFGEKKRSNMNHRQGLVDKLMNPENKVVIGIAGKYTHLDDCYLSVLESLSHAGAYYKTKVKIERIDTEKFENGNSENDIKKLIENKRIDGILIPGGFGNRGIEGMINIAKYCINNNIPYLGLCLGLQIGTIAFSRLKCGLKNANSTEFNLQTTDPIITIMQEQKKITDKGGTMRLGRYPALLKKTSKVHELYKKSGLLNTDNGENIKFDKSKFDLIFERHRHRYEVNPDYHQILEKNGLKIGGISPNMKLAEFIELEGHQYFLATQAHPEFKSRINKPHPLFLGLIKNSIK